MNQSRDALWLYQIDYSPHENNYDGNRSLVSSIFNQAISDAVTELRVNDCDGAERFINKHDLLFCYYCNLLGYEPEWVASKLKIEIVRLKEIKRQKEIERQIEKQKEIEKCKSLEVLPTPSKKSKQKTAPTNGKKTVSAALKSKKKVKKKKKKKSRKS